MVVFFIGCAYKSKALRARNMVCGCQEVCYCADGLFLGRSPKDFVALGK